MAAIFGRNTGKATKLLMNLDDVRDDEVQDVDADDYNFDIDGVHFKFEENSLFLLSSENRFRIVVVKIFVHQNFESFIMFIIILNAILFAQADYSHIDSGNNLISEGSFRNTILAVTNLPFLVIFTIECVLKGIGMGIFGRHGYLSDWWSWLDLIVVISGWLDMEANNNLPNISAVRALRVLRVLRGLKLKSMPGLKQLIKCIVKAMIQLTDTALFAAFVLTFFAILGTNIFSGPFMHARCRLTPYPVNTSWVNGLEYEDYRCLDVPNFNVPDEFPTWTKSTSPWSTPQECYWPLAPEEQPFVRFCSLLSGGLNQCYHDTDKINETEWSWCGSDYDALGNFRFAHVSNLDEFRADLNYGFSIFDNFGYSLISVFSVVTLAGWSLQMGLAMDAFDVIVAPAFFILLVLIASFVVLQLFLAVLADSFLDEKSRQERKREDHLRQKSGDGGAGKEKEADLEEDDDDNGDDETSQNGSKAGAAAAGSPMLTLLKAVIQYERLTTIWTDLRKGPQPQQMSAGRLYVRRIVSSMYFTALSTGMILVNALILTMDHYPSQATFNDDIDYINMALTIYFAVEMLLLLTAHGISFYLKDAFSSFDGIVIVASVMALIAYPPTPGDNKAGSGAAISVIRILRILRLFRLTTRFKTLQSMVRLIFTVFGEMGNFLLLYFIFIFICTLISLQFFANVQRYDSNGYVIKELLSPEWQNAPEHARYSFDDFNSAFATVFQIVTTENWNNVQYNLWRAQGSIAILFPCFVVGFGNFIMSNIFLGLLLTIFDSVKERERRRCVEEEEEEEELQREREAFERQLIGTGGNTEETMKDRSLEDVQEAGEVIVKDSVKMTSVVIEEGQKATGAERPPFEEDHAAGVDLRAAWRLLKTSSCLKDRKKSVSLRQELGLSRAVELAYCSRDDIEVLSKCLKSEYQADFLGKVGHVGHDVDNGDVDMIPPPMDTHSHGKTDLNGAWEILQMPIALKVSSESCVALLDELHISSAEDLANCERTDLMDLANYLKPVPHAMFLEKIGIIDDVLGETERTAAAAHTMLNTELDDIEKNGSQKHTPQPDNSINSPSPASLPADDAETARCAQCGVRFTDFSAYLSHECPNKSARPQRPTIAIESLSAINDTKLRWIFGSLLDALEPLRLWLFQFFEGEVYVWLMLVLIVISSVTLAMDNPLYDPASTYIVSLRIVDAIMTAAFALEMILKIFTYGFLYPRETAYIRDAWNQFDAFIVVTSIISLFSDFNPVLNRVKVVRAIRALRPLRMLRRIPGLAALMTAVVASIPDALNVLGIVLFIFSVFAIIAVTYLKGDLRSCQGAQFDSVISQNSTYMELLTYPKAWADMSIQEKTLFGPDSPVRDMSWCTSDWPSEPCGLPVKTADPYTYTSKEICHAWAGAWQPAAYRTFDNYPQALVSFFQISTQDGWVDTMWAAVDAAGIDMQPRRDNNQGYIYFFIVFMVIANLFALNLFIGVLITNVKSTNKKMGRRSSLVLTAEQEEWVTTQEIVSHLKPKKVERRPDGFIRGLCFDVCNSALFGKFIIVCIFLNTLILAMESFSQSENMEQFVTSANGAFSVIFTLEAIMKIIWLRHVYFHNGWNILDLVLIVVYDVLMFASIFVASHNVDIAARVFSIMRMVKVLDKNPRSKDIMNALGYALPQLVNIVLLLSLLLYIFAVVGVELFAKTQYYESYEERANFRSFEMALLTLLRFATMDAWTSFMYDASRHQKGCRLDPPYDPAYCGFYDQPGCVPLDGCGSTYIFPFLLVYVWVISLCTFNLFLGVIIESFVFANDHGNIVKNKDFRRFAKHWARFDPDATCYIEFDKMFEFVSTLFPPLGFAGENIDELVIRKRIAHLHLPLHRGGTMVHFRDVLSGLTTAAYMKYNAAKVRKSFIERNEQALIESLEVKTGKRRRMTSVARDFTGRILTSRQVIAATIIQRNFRAFLAYKRYVEKIRGMQRDVFISGVISESRFSSASEADDDSNSYRPLPLTHPRSKKPTSASNSVRSLSSVKRKKVYPTGGFESFLASPLNFNWIQHPIPDGVFYKIDCATADPANNRRHNSTRSRPHSYRQGVREADGINVSGYSTNDDDSGGGSNDLDPENLSSSMDHGMDDDDDYAQDDGDYDFSDSDLEDVRCQTWQLYSSPSRDIESGKAIEDRRRRGRGSKRVNDTARSVEGRTVSTAAPAAAATTSTMNTNSTEAAWGWSSMLQTIGNTIFWEDSPRAGAETIQPQSRSQVVLFGQSANDVWEESPMNRTHAHAHTHMQSDELERGSLAPHHSPPPLPPPPPPPLLEVPRDSAVEDALDSTAARRPMRNFNSTHVNMSTSAVRANKLAKKSDVSR